MGGVLSVRLDKELERKLKMLMAKKKIVDKSAYVRWLIAKSLDEELIDYLAEEVRKQSISVWKAAEIAGRTLRNMLKELADRGVEMYDKTALAEDLAFAERH